MRVAVAGGGVFGATAAVQFARAGHKVTLFERHPGLFWGATRANQGRLHSGYHYPRDPDSGLAGHAERFALRFPGSVVRSNAHYYAVAAAGSRTSGLEYLEFLRSRHLEHKIERPGRLRADAVDLCVRVPEALIDTGILRATLQRELEEGGVRLRFSTVADLDALEADYDLVVDATYGRGGGRVLQWEVCETAIVSLGGSLTGVSVVVMDGPFVSLDPLPGTGWHLLYDVNHTVRHRNVGTAPEIPGELAPYIDKGRTRPPSWKCEPGCRPVVSPGSTAAPAMIESARRFLRLEHAEWYGSWFTVRAVLPDVDATDERPTLVELDGKRVTILSGKICMAPWAARQAVDLAGVLASA